MTRYFFSLRPCVFALKPLCLPSPHCSWRSWRHGGSIVFHSALLLSASSRLSVGTPLPSLSALLLAFLASWRFNLYFSGYSALLISYVYFWLTRQTDLQPSPNPTPHPTPSKQLAPTPQNTDQMVFQRVTRSFSTSVIIAMEKFVLLPCPVTTGKGLGLGVSPPHLNIPD